MDRPIARFKLQAAGTGNRDLKECRNWIWQREPCRSCRRLRSFGCLKVAEDQDQKIAACGSSYRGAVRSEEFVLHRVLHQFRQRGDVQLLHQSRLVGADGLAAQGQLLGDVIDIGALGQAFEHGKLTLRKQ
jgi:hypothetical protein